MVAACAEEHCTSTETDFHGVSSVGPGMVIMVITYPLKNLLLGRPDASELREYPKPVPLNPCLDDEQPKPQTLKKRLCTEAFHRRTGGRPGHPSSAAPSPPLLGASQASRARGPGFRCFLASYKAYAKEISLNEGIVAPTWWYFGGSLQSLSAEMVFKASA